MDVHFCGIEAHLPIHHCVVLICLDRKTTASKATSLITNLEKLYKFHKSSPLPALPSLPTFPPRLTGTRATGFLVSHHIDLFGHLINDWSSKSRPDLYHFVPFDTFISLELRDFELILPANQYNWMDCESQHLENCYAGEMIADHSHKAEQPIILFDIN